MDNEYRPLNHEMVAWAAQVYAAHDIAPLLTGSAGRDCSAGDGAAR